jgi:hypothetical protein
MGLVKANRASDGKTVWVQSDKVDGEAYSAESKPKPAPKPRATRVTKNADNQKG